MAVPLQSDVPTFVAPAHTRREYARGQIVVRVHEDSRQVQSLSEPFEFLEREAGAHTLEPLPAGMTLVGLDEAAVSAQLLRQGEGSPAIDFAEGLPARGLPGVERAAPRQNRQWGLRAIRWFDTERPD